MRNFIMHPAQVSLIGSVGLFYLAYAGGSFFYLPLAIGLIFALICFLLMIVFSSCRKSILFISFFFYILYLLFARSVQISAPSFAFDKGKILHLEGVLTEDSLLTQTEKQLLRLNLQRCQTQRGYEGNASGLIPVLLDVDQILVAGTVIRLDGEWAEDGSLFISEDVQVLSMPKFSMFRRSFLKRMQERLSNTIVDEEVEALASMLLLGQMSQASFALKEQSLACGCAHTLALSGMHLHFFLFLSSSFFSLLFGPFLGKRIGLVIPFLYVCLIGPKPSLIRALGMYMFSVLRFSKVMKQIGPFYLTCMIQLFFFPFSVNSLGFLYSYTAFAMILLGKDLPPIPLKTTSLAILGTAPATFLLTGSWNIAGLIYSPLVTLLIHFLMAGSLLAIIFPFLGNWILPPILTILNAVFTFGSEKPLLFHQTGYVLYFVILLTSLVAIGYAKRKLQATRRRRYELELCLRFTKRNQQSITNRGVVDDQEVWSKFPSL